MKCIFTHLGPYHYVKRFFFLLASSALTVYLILFNGEYRILSRRGKKTVNNVRRARGLSVVSGCPGRLPMKEVLLAA